MMPENLDVADCSPFTLKYNKEATFPLKLLSSSEVSIEDILNYDNIIIEAKTHDDHLSNL